MQEHVLLHVGQQAFFGRYDKRQMPETKAIQLLCLFLEMQKQLYAVRLFYTGLHNDTTNHISCLT